MARRAISRAVDICRRLGRPEALRKVVRLMPRSWARCVIIRANLNSLPPIVSATVVATSLADFVTRARIASRTVIRSPRRNPNFDAGWPAARRDVVSFWSRRKVPLSRDSNNMYRVIILVKEAGYFRASTLRATRIRPLEPSTTSSAYRERACEAGARTPVIANIPAKHKRRQ